MMDKLLSVVAPHLCSGCGKIGDTFCDRCKYDIKEMPFLGCLLCEMASEAGICPSHETAYSQAWIVGERQGGLQRLIGGFKFQNMKASARSLAELLDERLPPLPTGTMVVPIPTAPSHIRERGYDHMLLVARYFARLRKLPVSRVIGRNTTATQHHANRRARIVQARSAFRIVGGVSSDIPYLLLDDVVTTGSTIAEASRVLKDVGVRTVWVGAIARQPLD
jgi:ComF family protein